ncbi:MAG: hypothetical protein KA150_11910, partial [Propionivibrio sp.]|nr:hypothetical protein [Propionivibrio sp.]
VDTGLVLNAALESVHQWILTGKSAAPTLAFERNALGAVVRDANGNALGGVRLSQFVVPTAELSPNGETIFCQLGGHHRDFTPAELKTRYGSHKAYVAQVRSAMKQVVDQGYVLPLDAEEVIRAAENSGVAR